MSQRTIVEFNHDYAHKLDGADDIRQVFARLVDHALRSGSKEDWEQLRRFGITRIVQCHHSDDRKVIVNRHEYPFG